MSGPSRFTRLRRRFGRSEGGVAAIEFALFSPFLILLLLGGFDVARFVMIHGRVAKVGFAVSDVTAQYEVLSPQAMKQIWLITGSSLPDYVSGTNGVSILTSVTLDDGAPKVKWQCRSSEGGAWVSQIGAENGAATIPENLLADAMDNVVVSEIYYRFDPMFSLFFKNGFDIYSKGLFRPRLGTLIIKPC